MPNRLSGEPVTTTVVVDDYVYLDSATSGVRKILVSDLSVVTSPLTEAVQLLGGNLLYEGVGTPLVLSAATPGLVDNNLYFGAVFVPANTVLTGVAFIQRVQGSYTSDQYNGVGLYSYSGGTLTLVASSTDDGTIWKAAAGAYATKAFTTPYTAVGGIYFVAMLYNSSAETTAPTIAGPAALGVAAMTTLNLTNSARVWGNLNAQNTLPASFLMSSAIVPAGNALRWFALY